MARGGRDRARAPFAPANALPEGRVVDVRSKDGVRLHAEVFGPPDGYPIVLAHGITCALQVWAYQIADLAQHYRVIAYDHRGHGRSAVPPRPSDYSLDHLAADLDAVLDATLKPDERAVIAGHSMGGIAITSWSERCPQSVGQRADAVALINTTTGDLLRNINLLPVPARVSGARVQAAGSLLRIFGSAPPVRAADVLTHRFVASLAVGGEADPAIKDFIFDLFNGTPSTGRGGWIRVLVDHLGPRHIGLHNLSVPTLVIGSHKDRLLPMASSRHIATAAPNLAKLVELPGGHCAILERPADVNTQLRWLIDTATAGASAATGQYEKATGDDQERRISS